VVKRAEFSAQDRCQLIPAAARDHWRLRLARRGAIAIRCTMLATVLMDSGEQDLRLGGLREDWST